MEHNRFKRRVRETLEIKHRECGPRKAKGGVNLDDGQYITTNFWTPFFNYLPTQRNQYIADNATNVT